MNHRERVFDYLNGHLDEPERKEFENQLTRDPSLAALLAEVRQEMTHYRASYQQMRVPPLAASAREEIGDQIVPPRRLKLRRRLLWPALAAAALIFVLLYQTLLPAPEPAEVRLVVATPNPKVVIYLVDQLPQNLWQGDEP